MSEFEIRNFNSKDIFPICTIIKKIGIEEFKNAFSNPEIMKLVDGNKRDENTVKLLGMNIMIDIASIIVGNLPKCQGELYAFLSSITGIKVKELEALSMADFAELIIDVIKKDDFKDFFGVVSKLLN